MQACARSMPNCWCHSMPDGCWIESAEQSRWMCGSGTCSFVVAVSAKTRFFLLEWLLVQDVCACALKTALHQKRESTWNTRAHVLGISEKWLYFNRAALSARADRQAGRRLNRKMRWGWIRKLKQACAEQVPFAAHTQAEVHFSCFSSIWCSADERRQGSWCEIIYSSSTM